MKILAIDSSAITASAALCDGERVIKSKFLNLGLTHSETLMPMIKRVMNGEDFKSLDAIAVTAGPGSFTGVRIGVSSAKGLAFNNDTPCISVSTLEAIAYNFLGENAVICAVMDARRMQFYNALFEVDENGVKRLTPDRAIALEALEKELKKFESVIIAGDGARLCFDNTSLKNVSLADEDKIFQNAVSVALAAQNKKTIPASALMPTYLRQSQAERELKLKTGE